MKTDKKKNIIGLKSGRLIFAALIAVFLIAGSIAGFNLIMTEVQSNAAQNEYNELRQFAPVARPPQPSTDGTDGTDIDEQSDIDAEPHETMPDLSAFNPDYVGWIRIGGTNIDYPVVQGRNNTRYLNTTFMGERNRSGTIFMDNESTEGFTGLAILHGHNMRNGTMFADLHHFRDSDFLAEHNEITIFTPDGEKLTYTVFDVIMTNRRNTIFTLPIEGQEAFTEYFAKYNLVGHLVRDRSGILALSTCTDGSRNERLVILAVKQ